jgi:phosphatidylglycerophosphatase A
MKWYKIISTWFGLGCSSFMPGTIGSLGAFPIFYFAAMSSTTIYEAKITMLFFLIILSIIGYFAIRLYHKDTKVIDDQSIVIDEVIGQLVTLALAYEWIGSFVTKINLIPPNTGYTMSLLYIFFVAFILFRFFDITKPFYISLIDRYWKNAVGVILDDILAGIAAAAVLYILQ